MLVSVVMPVYNGEKYIAEAIESILDQSFKDFELLIINDASTDNTVSIIKKYNDTRIRLIHNDENLGLARVRNIGIENAEGKYIAWLDADDISVNTRLEKQVLLLEKNPDVGLCGTWVKTIGAVEHVWQYPTISKTIKSVMLFDNTFATSSVMLRKEILYSHNIRFNVDYPPAEDYDLWENISLHTEVVNIPKVLTLYRLHPAQTTSSDDAKVKQLKSAWAIQKRILSYLDIDPDEKEKKLHIGIGLQYNFTYNNDEVKEVNEWLHRLYFANLEYHKFDHHAFAKTLTKSLYNVYSASSCKGLNPLKSFSKASFYRLTVSNLYLLVKLSIKKYK
ncbi:glycosyltransferase family 2 protein [Sulfurovum sp.]|uniref:glycosyltransferase family 2 protein n=1 Tax=Sulfurovum sp. TaxID=1969726 RepID=UPI0035612C8C